MPALPPQLLAASQSTHLTEANTLGKTGRGYDPASQRPATANYVHGRGVSVAAATGVPAC